MERNIDFDNVGGMPLSQDLLKRMQSNYDTGLQRLLYIVSSNMDGSGILDGVVETSAGVYSDGVVIHKGVLYQFKGGVIPNDSKVEIVSSKEQATYEDGLSRDAYTTSWIEPKQGGSISFEDFLNKRIDNLEKLKDSIVSTISKIDNVELLINARIGNLIHKKTYIKTIDQNSCSITVYKHESGYLDYLIKVSRTTNSEIELPVITDDAFKPNSHFSVIAIKQNDADDTCVVRVLSSGGASFLKTPSSPSAYYFPLMRATEADE